MQSTVRTGIFAATTLLACGTVVEPQIELTPGAGRLVAVTNARVIPMHDERVLDDYVILLRGDTIAAMGPAADVEIPADATRIDVGGQFVLPGFIDMHVHISRDDLQAYIAHGVTAVRNMWGFVNLASIQADIEDGEIRGPRIQSLSSGFDGSPPRWPETQLVDDVARVAPLIDAAEQQGYREIKVYASLSPEAYDSIVVIAKRRGLTFAGHVPLRIPVQHAFERGQRSIEHLLGYDAAVTNLAGVGGFGRWANIDVDALASLAESTRQAGTWNCPTLAIAEAIVRGSAGAAAIVQNRGRMVKALHDAGARLLAGTDAGIDVTRPGAALADELRLMVDAGLPPYDALLGATRYAAEYLGREDIGTITVGGRADLVILADNPLRDIGAVRRVQGVVLRGEFIGR